MDSSKISIIKNALMLALDTELAAADSLPKMEAPNKEELLQKIHKRHSEQEKNKKRLPIRFLIAAAIIAALIISITVTAAVIIKESNTGLVENTENGNMHLSAPPSEQKNVTVNEVFLPSYIPSGYEHISSERGKSYAINSWKNGEQKITVEQSPIGGSAVLIDQSAKEELIGGYNSYLVRKDGYILVLFRTEDYIFIITAYPEIEISEIGRIIESFSFSEKTE